MAIVLEEELDVDYVPTEKETQEYAEWLGFDLDRDSDLLWVAKAGLKAPLPHPWKPCQVANDGDLFYFNFETGESVWDHPSDEHYRRLYQLEAKEKYGEAPLTEEEKDFLAKAVRQPPIRPCKIGTLIVSLSDSGVAEISAMSMGGNVLATSKLKSPDDSFKALQRRLNRHAGEDLKLVLPDGRLLDVADRKKSVRELLELPAQEGGSPEQSTSKETRKGYKLKSRKTTHQARPGTVVSELAPVKVHGRLQFCASDATATSGAVTDTLQVAVTGAVSRKEGFDNGEGWQLSASSMGANRYAGRALPPLLR